MKYSSIYHSPKRSQIGNRTVPRCESRGFTLLELILALSITALVVVSLSGLLLAVQNAWTVSKNYHEVGLHGRAILDRINWMVSQAGTYRIKSGPVRLGLSVISRSVDGVARSVGRVTGVSAVTAATPRPRCGSR